MLTGDDLKKYKASEEYFLADAEHLHTADQMLFCVAGAAFVDVRHHLGTRQALSQRLARPTRIYQAYWVYWWPFSGKLSHLVSVRAADNAWVRVHLKAGDMLRVAEGCYHRFSLDEDGSAEMVVLTTTVAGREFTGNLPLLLARCLSLVAPCALLLALTTFPACFPCKPTPILGNRTHTPNPYRCV